MNLEHSKRSTKLGKVLALALLGTSLASAQTLSIRTMAGGPTSGATNGFGSNARFAHPVALAADDAGNVFVADTENSTIRKIDSAGYASTFAGLAGSPGTNDGASAAARFYGPQGIAAAAGQLYVADTGNSTIRQIALDGTVSTLAGSAGDVNSYDGAGTVARFYHPEGLAVGPDGNIYVADTWNHTIRRITSAGQVTTLAGLAGFPGSVDGTNSKARFNRPAAIAADTFTNLYVADSFNHTLRKITAGGTVTTLAGLPGVWGSTDQSNNAARFYLPEGICITATGDLLVADSGNQTLRKVSLVGTNWAVTTVAGLSGLAGNINGTGSGTQFYFPGGIDCDNAGYLYVADLGNNKVRTTRVVQPTIESTRLSGELVLSWPASAEGFGLYQTPTFGPTASWSPITAGIVTNGDNIFSTNSMITAAFYRLRFP
jgi:sugar lactone lactonase YvrE